MKNVLKGLVAAGLTMSILVGCGGAPSTDAGTTDATATDQAAGVKEEAIGDYVTPVKEGVITLPGFTFTLPEDLASDASFAGWERVGYENAFARIFISDPNEGLINQPAHPGIFEIMAIPASRTLEDYFEEQAQVIGQPIPDGYLDCFVDLGSNETYHYFAEDMAKVYTVLENTTADDNRAFLEEVGVDSERIARSEELSSRFDEYVKCFKVVDLKLPKMQTADDINVSELAGMTLQDLDGKQVKLADIFAKNKVTMIDIWKTDCTACVESMPDLEALSKEYADQGFGVLSVCADVMDDDGSLDDDLLYDAQDIVKTAGTTYPTVLAGKQFRDLIDVVSTPTILYVDSQGNIIDGPSRGAYPKDITAKYIEMNLEKAQ